MLRGRVLAVGLVMSILVAACGGGGSASDGSEAGGVDPDEVSRLVPSHLEVAVSGDVEIAFERDMDLRVVAINQPEVSQLKFLSVGMERFAEVGDGSLFRIAFDLIGSFDGAGEYELPVAGDVATPSIDPENPDANAAASGLSRVYLTYSPEGDFRENPESAALLQSFENAVRPCQVAVTHDEGASGRLECPEVAAADGSSVEIIMEWEAV